MHPNSVMVLSTTVEVNYPLTKSTKMVMVSSVVISIMEVGMEHLELLMEMTVMIMMRLYLYLGSQTHVQQHPARRAGLGRRWPVRCGGDRDTHPDCRPDQTRFRYQS